MGKTQCCGKTTSWAMRPSTPQTNLKEFVSGSPNVDLSNSQTSLRGTPQEDWQAWDLSGIPEHLQMQKSTLLAALTDSAPVHLLLPDKWGWGKSGFYSVAQGYVSLQTPQAPIESTILWKQVWDPLGLPKVNFFCWILMHRKLLTGENLTKRGIIGPHRCPMCCNAPETTDHLFVDCSFAQEVWKISLQGLNITTLNQISVVNLFSSWKARYPQEIQSSPNWKRIWQAIPKYICWKLWLARNDQIFNNKLAFPPFGSCERKISTSRNSGKLLLQE
jgi:hypothetical protein